MACDYIIFAHMPSKLNIDSYTENGFPSKITYNGSLVKMVYFHLVKQRSGDADFMFPMWNDLKYFDFNEMGREFFDEIWTMFKQKGEVIYNT